jgi:integrase
MPIFQRENGKFYARLFVPTEHQSVVRQKELKRSLKTSDPKIANQRLHAAMVELQQQLDRLIETGRKLAAVSKDPESDPLSALMIRHGFARRYWPPDEVDAALTAMRSRAVQYVKTVARAASELDDRHSRILEAQGAASPELTSWVDEDADPYFDVAVIEADLHSLRRSEAEQIRLNQLLEEYKKERSDIRNKSLSDISLALSEFQGCVGNKAIEKYSKNDLFKYIDELKARNIKANTIRKKKEFIHGVFQFAVSLGKLSSNPFSGIKLTNTKGSSNRRPYSPDELQLLFNIKMKSDIRLLLTLLTVTGARLDEIALLRCNDFKTQDGVFYIDLEREGAILKNSGSRRQIPLHKVVHQTVRTAIAEAGGGSNRLFPAFPLDADGKATNAASKRCLRITGQLTPKRTVHELRHTFKRLCRDADVLEEIHDQLTGHTSQSISRSYGKGASLKKLDEAIQKLEHPWIC